MIVIGTVLTNCEEDDFRRVKVSSPHVWQESDLMPSIGAIYLDKGDQVIVDISSGVDNAFIRGKVMNSKQKEKSVKGEGVLLYEAQKDGKYSAAFVTEQNFTFINSDGVKIEVNGANITITQENKQVNATNLKIEVKETVSVKADKVNVESSNAEVKSQNIKLDGKVTFTHGSGQPNGKGPLLCIPNCLFSGAPISGNETM